VRVHHLTESLSAKRRPIVGIDAANLRSGGGVTHLVELLSSADVAVDCFDSVHVWTGSQTANRLPRKDWLHVHDLPELNGNLLRRSLWQRYKLGDAAREAKCDCLFVPGGVFAGRFKPVVTMSQNLLPFEGRELFRFGLSATTLRLLALRFLQSKSFRRSDGVIFLSDYAKSVVTSTTGRLRGEVQVINHGLSPRFLAAPRPQNAIEDYCGERPFRILYVSIVNAYKHQWSVVEAVADLRKKGFPLRLDLVGPSEPRPLRRLLKVIKKVDPLGNWAKYAGPIPYTELHQYYKSADLGVFASSCENLPITLLENMASGLPIACSNLGPMPEVLGKAGVYFDPESSESIRDAIEQLVLSPRLRADVAQLAFARSQDFNWERCAKETFSFLERVSLGHRQPA
jgi:glycosyltransferase involved in cell wall biosynthesis